MHPVFFECHTLVSPAVQKILGIDIYAVTGMRQRENRLHVTSRIQNKDIPAGVLCEVPAQYIETPGAVFGYGLEQHI